MDHIIGKDNIYLISIIIPVYNAEAFIVECLDHIKCQDFHNYEIIIVNDGSKDRTQQVCEEYIKQNQEVNIRLINQVNSGVSVARNIGISRAKGEWVTFVDADDFLTEDALQWFASIDLTGKDVILANYARSDDLQEPAEGNIMQIDSELLLRCVLRYAKYCKKMKKIYGIDPYINWTCWGKFYKRAFLVLNKVSFPKGVYTSEDTVFLIMLYNSHPQIFASNKIIYIYNVNINSVTHTFNAKIVDNTIELARNLETILDESYAEDLNAYLCERIIHSYFYIFKNSTEKKETVVMCEISDKYKKANCFEYILRSGYRKVFVGKQYCLNGCRLLFKLKRCKIQL